MAIISRRRFISQAGSGGLISSMVSPADWLADTSINFQHSEFSQAGALAGNWHFRLDPHANGESQGWHLPGTALDEWTDVEVPHTWQTTVGMSSFFGSAWYRKEFEAPATWETMSVRLEFEAVYHSAVVWLNGKQVGQHWRKGYTAFTVDLSRVLQAGLVNTLAVRVDNTFDSTMLPRGNSYDWTPDGGITRPVNLLVTPRVFVEYVEADALPDLSGENASVDVRMFVNNSSAATVTLKAAYRIMEEKTGRIVLQQSHPTILPIPAGEIREIAFPQSRVINPKLWHFDHPDLYQLEGLIEPSGQLSSSLHVTFGIRRFEVRQRAFFLNGERVWLMGVERMAGSHPDYGMAEPRSWLVHDHDDMKDLNCVFTRVHWQQDRRVLDYCDRHGILIQVEVPTWGPETFKGMDAEPDTAIMENGLEQLREMIRRDRNHPSIFAWGLCNEINGQNPPAYSFARRMYEEAQRLDPHRLRTYASNSLQTSPAKDVSGLMDFIEWNEYYESWYGGSLEDVKRNLEAIHQAFPDKVVVISEYGYCECAEGRPSGDQHRVRVLHEHTNIYRNCDFVGGAIFFCYNDYRTHIGDKGLGPLKQRVHGVVDLYGRRKPSFEALRQESSPIEELILGGSGREFTAALKTRRKLPAYRLEGYKLRWIVYGYEDLPMEQGESPLPTLFPGDLKQVSFTIQEKAARRVRVDIVRPTGFSTATTEWQI